MKVKCIRIEGIPDNYLSVGKIYLVVELGYYIESRETISVLVLDENNKLKKLRVDGKIVSNYKAYSYDSLSYTQGLCQYINLK